MAMKLEQRDERDGLYFGIEVETGLTVFWRVVREAPEQSLPKKYFTLLQGCKSDLGTCDILRMNRVMPPNFERSLFMFLAELKKPLRASLEAIEEFLTVDFKISAEEVRGAFAELALLETLPGFMPNDSMSVFDLSRDGEQIEVKSYSARKGEIYLSDAQLLNDGKIAIYVVELLESSAEGGGMTLLQLVERSRCANEHRYAWIKKSDLRGNDKVDN